MAIFGTIAAGLKLVIFEKYGADMSCSVIISGVDSEVKDPDVKSSKVYGPYGFDASYSITINRGSPAIYTENPDGVKEYTASALPDPASLPVGAEVVVDGNLMKNTETGLAISAKASRRSSVSVDRLYGVGASFGSGAVTGVLITQAPSEYDAIRLTLVSTTASNAKEFSYTVAPSATFNKIGPVDSVGARIAETAVTWGSTDNSSPLNPSGGVATVTPSGASGSTPSTNYIQSRIRSDIIPLKSVARADGGDRPLLVVKGYGAYLPGDQNVEHSFSATNDIQVAIGQEFSGYRTGSFLTTDPSYNAGLIDSGGYWTQNGRLTVEIEYFLRGKQCINIGITGDSTDQGWVDPSAVPQFGGNINGYMRRVVNKMREKGAIVGYSVFAQAGQRSFVTYRNALPAVLSGELTHLVIRPFSINDTNTGTTEAVALDCLQRTSLLIQTCKAHGVVPILLRPFACGTYDAIQYPLVMQYVDGYKASGGLVLDLTPVLNQAGSLQYLKPEYVTVNAGGTQVDPTHINDAGHQAAADYIYRKLMWLFS